MLLSKDPMGIVLDSHYQKALQNNYSWVWTFHPSEGTWTDLQMQQVLRYLKDMPGAKETVIPETLRVIPTEGKAYLEVEGITNISVYCLAESPKKVPHRWVQRVMHTSERLPDEFDIPVQSQIRTSTSKLPGRCFLRQQA